MRSDLRVKLPDGSVVGYAEAGDPAGRPVIYLHGTPSSRLEVGLPGIREAADDLDLRVLAPDRPGIGLSTFRRYSTTATSQIIRIVDSSNIVIDNLSVRGPIDLAFVQTRTFGTGDREDEHAVSIESVTNLTIRGGSFTNTRGDALYIRARNETSTAPTNIVISGVVMDINGRNNISVIGAKNLRLTGSTGSNASLHGFDAEPNRSTDILQQIRIDNTSFTTFDAAHTSSGPGYAIAISPGYANVQAQDVQIQGVSMDLAMVLVAGYDTAHPAITVTITGCRPATSSGRGAILEHIDGLTFTDNGLLTPHLTDAS